MGPFYYICSMKHTRYDGESTLPTGQVLAFGIYGQLKVRVLEDLGHELRLICINKKSKQEPFILAKLEYKGCLLKD